jgi:hypothetical protein
MALTSPTINLYYIKIVTPQIYTAAQVISTLSAAIITMFLSKQSNRDKFKKYFAPVLVLDSIGFLALSYLGTLDANIRFIGFAILFSTTLTIWSTIMTGAINNTLSSEELTDFQTLSRSVGLWATVAGGVMAILLVNVLPLNLALFLQCASNAILAVCDYKVFYYLMKEA